MPSHPTRHTIARQWQLLKLLPGRHPGMSSTQLQAALTTVGHTTSKRTVERDLVELAALFPLQCNSKGMPYGWYWQPACLQPVLPRRHSLTPSYPKLQSREMVALSMSSPNGWRVSPITPMPCTGCSKRQSSRALWLPMSRSVPMLPGIITHYWSFFLQQPYR